MTAFWEERGDHIRLISEDRILIEDSIDHWRNGVLRLMGWNAVQGKEFARAAVLASGGDETWFSLGLNGRLDAMMLAFRKLYPEPAGAAKWYSASLDGLTSLSRPLSGYWFYSLAGDDEYAIARVTGLTHGVLLRRDDLDRPIFAVAPEYEDEYFEGGQVGYGYGNLEDQEEWRLQKSRRQAQKLSQLVDTYVGQPAGLSRRLLDVGSGYGYLRAAIAELGWEHEGVELSGHATSVARRLFGFPSFVGKLEDVPWSNFDLITLMDLVEHVLDPVQLLREVCDRLAPRGICVIRTPNLLSQEARVFGGFYHSLKREHLHVFSLESLNWCCEAAGMVPVFSATEAHLFRGFIGSGVDEAAAKLEGSDIFAAFRRAG